VVCPDVVGLAADFVFFLEFSEFDAAADVGEGEGDLVVFQNNKFLLSRRGRGFNRQLGGGGVSDFRDGGGSLLLDRLARPGCGSGLLVLAGVVEVGRQEGAT